MSATPLQILWFILLGVLVTGYFVLDGFDLGIGVLYPFIGKTEVEKATLRTAIGPVWDGNEVWLLTGGGALFAAFAPAYATSFSGFYLAIMLVLFGLIARAAAIEFRALDPKWAKFWDVCFFVGSLLPALLFGVAVGNVVRGLPLDANGDYAGTFFGLLNPFSLLVGILGLAQFILQGSCFAALKAPKDSALYARVAAVRAAIKWVVFALVLAVTAYAHVLIEPVLAGGLVGILRIVFAVVVFGALIIGHGFVNNKRDLASFICSSLVSVGLVGLFATTIYPNLIPAAAGSTGPAITIASAGGSNLALTWMTIIACIGVPLVLFYHYLIYKSFNGRIQPEELDY
ncbi:MAG: cytochrome d ubiquinol oxidase subunit II [Actinomycetes bacterium]|jgi:cytochrome d ubiquinol oxidase subunit II|nr:cytochrome d ubiquinol oxidase subunit II [Actinomycetes bacterium]